jgi:hypothetical protein
MPTYVVSKDAGSDGGSGSSANPWKTIGHAAGLIVPGDTVLIRASSTPYNEYVDLTYKVGTASAKIALQNYLNELPIIDGTGIAINHNGRTVILDHSSYLTLQGLEIRNCGLGIQGYGVNCTYGGAQNHDITLRNLIIHGCAAGAIAIGMETNYSSASFCYNILVDGCHDYGNCIEGVDEAVSLIGVDGFEIVGSIFGPNAILTGARQGDMQSHLDCKVGCKNGKIHGNEFDTANLYISNSKGIPQFNIDVYGNYWHGFGAPPVSGAALTLNCELNPVGSLANELRNVNIFNNNFYNNYRVFLVLDQAYWNNGDSTPFNKTFKFVHNNLYLNAPAGTFDILVRDPAAWQQNCVIANNIIYMRAPTTQIMNTGGAGLVNDRNIYYNVAHSYPADSDHQYGTNPIFTDPLMVNPPTDFSLQATSPARDAANPAYAPTTDFLGVARPQGPAPDIGAYEYAGGTGDKIAFGPGQAETARIPITVKPAGVTCQVELFLGPDQNTKIATSHLISFVSTGAEQPVLAPITMPTTEATYHVYVDLWSGSLSLQRYVSTQDVIIVSGVVGPIIW